MRKVSDVNLEEDEVLKPASFGNEANNKDTVDIIRKSVVILIKCLELLIHHQGLHMPAASFFT